MNFSHPQDHLDHRARVEAFVREKIAPLVVDVDETGEFPHEAWRECAAFGIQAMAAPAAYGGPSAEVEFSRALLAMEGFGYACPDAGLPFALNTQMWTVQMPLLAYGTEEQKAKYLRPLVDGSRIACHALTEPEAGSDVMSMQLTATKVDGGYLLNGVKRLITLGPVADWVLLFANARPEMGKWGISAFIVEAGAEGFTRPARNRKMGLRGVPLGELHFEDCFVAEEQRLGGEGAGFGIMNHSLEYDRCSILASQLGAMERQLEQSIGYVKKRKQFGQAVGGFQSVSNRIADMKLRLETSRLLLYKTAWLKEQGKSALLEAALLKLQLSEAFVSSSLDHIRNFGGSGYLSEFGVEKDLRDAVGGVLYAGTSDVQRNIVAKLLGL